MTTPFGGYTPGPDYKTDDEREGVATPRREERQVEDIIFIIARILIIVGFIAAVITATIF